MNKTGEVLGNRTATMTHSQLIFLLPNVERATADNSHILAHRQPLPAKTLSTFERVLQIKLSYWYHHLKGRVR
jgi:hypothetical protein